MRFLAHPWAVRLRSAARALGLTKLFTAVVNRRSAAAQRRARRHYRRERPASAQVDLGAGDILLAAVDEQEYVRALAFSRDRPLIEALTSRLGEGDCFWDVGANAGAYSCSIGKFLDARPGSVVAFEPDPSVHERLRENLALNALDRVTTFRMALSDREGVAGFALDPHDTTTGHLVPEGDAEGRELIEVRTASGDRIVDEGDVPAPNVIKVDTEGFELEVLAGLRRTLASPGCRFVLVEVHFSVLRSRGLDDAPRRIESLLRGAGFEELYWIDVSHLAASKPPLSAA